MSNEMVMKKHLKNCGNSVVASCERKLNRELKVQECDARMFNRITEPSYKNILTNDLLIRIGVHRLLIK
jgi:hypothetical protein